MFLKTYDLLIQTINFHLFGFKIFMMLKIQVLIISY